MAISTEIKNRAYMNNNILILIILIGITSCISFNMKKKPKVSLDGCSIGPIFLNDMSFLFSHGSCIFYIFFLTVGEIVICFYQNNENNRS
ncbi:hypothetical protein ACFL20_07145 [Spirochaetota bacterium]